MDSYTENQAVPFKVHCDNITESQSKHLGYETHYEIFVAQELRLLAIVLFITVTTRESVRFANTSDIVGVKGENANH